MHRNCKHQSNTRQMSKGDNTGKTDKIAEKISNKNMRNTFGSGQQ